MKQLLFAVILLVTVNATAQVSEKKIRKYASTICAKELKAKLSVLASADMEGRETATAGQRKAAAYIEKKFRDIGLLPGNNTSYQQVFNLYQDSLSASSLTVNGKTLDADKDYALSVSAIPSGTWNIQEIFFAGAGVLDTTHLPVEGKWVMIDEGGFFAMRQKIMQLRKRNAKGIIVVSKSFPRTAATAVKGPMYTKAGANEFPFISVSYNAASQMLSRPSLDSAGLTQLEKQPYTTNVTLVINKQQLTLQSTNVIGVLPGTDKKDEYVFITAHYDHLGKKGSVIYYGADDDGSGTTSVLEIAEAFAAAKKKGNGPRRTIVFMTVSGEEKGLLGSEYYAEHPLFPLNKTTVDLNIDMVGRIDPQFKGDSMNYVYVIGDDKLSSDLRPITDSINLRYSNLQLDRKYNDVKDPNRFYYRSDHYNFAKNGVPVIFYFNGTHADYHQPGDTVDKIRFDLMEKRVKLVFYTAWDMANRNEMLKRDIPLNIPPR